MKKIFILLAVLTFIFVGTGAQAATFWGQVYGGGGGARLFQFDTSTSTATMLGSFSQVYYWGDLAQTSDGQLYVSYYSTSWEKKFARVNQTTWTLEDLIVSVGSGDSWDYYLNSMYAAGDSLYVLENTGGGSKRGWLGQITFDVGGNPSLSWIGAPNDPYMAPDGDLVRDPDSGNLLGTYWQTNSNSVLHELDPTDASIESSLSLDIPFVAGLAFDESNLLWAGRWDSPNLYTVNLSTGQSAFQLDLTSQLGSFTGIQGLSESVAPVPIPGAVWLLGSGLVGLVGLRRRLK